MKQFKENFKKNTGNEWKFQDKQLEDQYTDFIHAQEATDPDVIKDKTMDDINEGFKNFFNRVQQHKKQSAKKD
jgi:hypothetical protein